MSRLFALVAVAGIAGALFLGSTCGLLNKPPSVPEISGPTTGIVGVPVTFTATDPEGDSIAFQFAWGDGDTSDWSALFASGETTTLSHTYADTGSYSVAARAKDQQGAEGAWSTPHSVAVVAVTHDYPDSLVGDVIVDGSPRHGVVTPDGRYLYITHDQREYVTPVRLADRQVLPRVTVGPWPFDIAASPDGQYVYTTCLNGSSVAAVRVSDNIVVAEIQVGTQPHGIAITPDGQYAYIAVSGPSRLTVVSIPASSVVDSIPLPDIPQYLVASPTGDYVYVGMLHGKVGAVRTSDNALVMTGEAGQLPGRLRLSADGRSLYVANQTDSGFAVLSSSDLTRTGTVRIGSPSIHDADLLAGGDCLLATDWYGLRYVNTQINASVDSLPYGSFGGVAVHPSGDTIYAFSGAHLYVVGRR